MEGAVHTCDFQDSTICGYTQDTDDDFNWGRTSGSTSSVDTGPAYDYTYGTSLGNHK